MDSFRRNQEQFKSAVEGAFANTPFADMAKRNLACSRPRRRGSRPPRLPPAPTPAPTATAASKDAEMAALKAELAALKDKIEKLGSNPSPPFSLSEVEGHAETVNARPSLFLPCKGRGTSEAGGGCHRLRGRSFPSTRTPLRQGCALPPPLQRGRMGTPAAMAARGLRLRSG